MTDRHRTGARRGFVPARCRAMRERGRLAFVVAAAAGRACGSRGRRRLRPGARGEELRQDRRARCSTSRFTPEFQARLTAGQPRQRAAEVAKILATDPERNFPATSAPTAGNECAGDVRFYDWKDAGFGIVKPVLFTARNGSTISGRVWATDERSGQAPGDRDHDRLGAGARAALLGTGGDARQARLRRAHLRHPGPGALRHLRRGRRPARRRAVPGGPAVLRRHRGRARLPALDAGEAL